MDGRRAAARRGRRRRSLAWRAGMTGRRVLPRTAPHAFGVTARSTRRQHLLLSAARRLLSFSAIKYLRSLPAGASNVRAAAAWADFSDNGDGGTSREIAWRHSSSHRRHSSFQGYLGSSFDLSELLLIKLSQSALYHRKQPSLCFGGRRCCVRDEHLAITQCARDEHKRQDNTHLLLTFLCIKHAARFCVQNSAGKHIA